MSEFQVRIPSLNGAMDSVQTLESILQEAANGVMSVRRNLRVQIRQRERIDSRLTSSARNLENQRTAVGRVVRTGRLAAEFYEKTEAGLLKMSASGSNTAKRDPNQDGFLGWWQSFIDKIKEWFAPKPVISTEINSIVFDDDGAYGGNQGSPVSVTGKERQALYDLVRKYYPNYTDREIRQYMKKLNSEGCGYVAVINTIFAAFEGREKEFEQKFGFPMYGTNGDLNYNRLLVDYYAATDNHNKDQFGKDYINNGEDSSDVKGRGTTQYDREYRTHLYLDQKSVPVFVENDYHVTLQNFAQVSKDGYVIISFRYGNLQNANGSVAQYIDGGHAMVVTGVTEDGRYVVSSWGKKYYIDPKEQIEKNGNSTSFTFAHYQYK